MRRADEGESGFVAERELQPPRQGCEGEAVQDHRRGDEREDGGHHQLAARMAGRRQPAAGDAGHRRGHDAARRDPTGEQPLPQAKVTAQRRQRDRRRTHCEDHRRRQEIGGPGQLREEAAVEACGKHDEQRGDDQDDDRLLDSGQLGQAPDPHVCERDAEDGRGAEAGLLHD